MLYVESNFKDPAMNLALEEYLFSQKKEEVFMLWQNTSSIIIGKSQNAMAEIDYDYVTSHNIPVIRRITGGGAVYHDLGNVNFTYITNRSAYGDYSGFTKMLREYLSALGVQAEISGRNDVLVEGKKISGNAQCLKNGRLLHHGCILICTDMHPLEKALKPDREKILSKGISSVKSRVANISDFIDITATDFFCGFGAFVQDMEHVIPYTLSEEDVASVEKLYREKYTSYAWNYGYSPKYSFHQKKRFPGGGVEVFLDICDGIIQDAHIFGDFLGDAEPIQNMLRGVPHNYRALQEKIRGVTLGTITEEEILACLI